MDVSTRAAQAPRISPAARNPWRMTPPPSPQTNRVEPGPVSTVLAKAFRARVPAVLRQVAARLRDTFASVPPTREAGPAAAAFGMRLVTQPPRRAVTAAAALGR